MASAASESGERLIASALMPSVTAGAAFCVASSPASEVTRMTSASVIATSCNDTAAAESVKLTSAAVPATSVTLSSCAGEYQMRIARTEYVPNGTVLVL